MMHPDSLVFLTVLAFVLGAVLICCLLVRYGFARNTDPPTRLGHAIAAALFGTGVVFAVLALTAVPLGGVERYRDLLDRLRERVDRVRTGLVAVEGVVESLGQRTERALRAILPAQPSAVPAPGPLASSPLPETPAARTGGDSVAVGPPKLGPEGSSSVIASPPAAPGGRPVRSVPLAARVAPPERRQDSVQVLEPERLQPPTPVDAHLARAHRREISEDSVPGAKPGVDRERQSAERADHAAAAGSPKNVERAALPAQGVPRQRDDLLDTRPGLDRRRPEEPREHPLRDGPPGRAEHTDPLEPVERTERSEQIERAERPERVERTEQTERIERAERPERVERTERLERIERAERPERIERTERPERIERAERPERTERPERVERVERVVERLDRIERLERRGR